MTRSTVAVRLALAAALAGGVSYLAADYLTLPAGVNLAWKGSGVGFLAVYAALSARTFDGWLLCAVMAFGAAGDVLLGAAGFTVGGAAFLVGHLVAIWLYRRNQRPGLERPAWLAAVALVAATVTSAFLLPADRSAAPGVAVYAVGLSCMAAGAWLSRFPRRVPVGAMLFVVSDLLIFARGGPLHAQPGMGFAIWSLYFAGEALICTGVARALAREDARQRPPESTAPPGGGPTAPVHN